MPEPAVEAALTQLVIANRILAREGVIDDFGHVSVRHPSNPGRYFLSRSRSPELVTRDDLLEFDLDCNPIDQRGREIYIERPIHGGIYQARPDVNAVVHAGLDANGAGLMISSSRAILFAEDPKHAARALHEQIEAARKGVANAR